MTSTINATFEVASWDESAFDEGDDVSKLTRASVTGKYGGDIAGESVIEWLMAYAEEGTATFVGLERLRGTVDGKQGSLVIQHIGGYRDNAATADLTVVAGSGTGDLVGVSGVGHFTANPSGTVELELDFS